VADLLLELFSEEIPARMLDNARIGLVAHMQKALGEGNLFTVDPSSKVVLPNVQVFATPRRLTAFIKDVPEKQYYRPEDRRGPRVDAPEKAIQGFLKSIGCSKDQTWEQEGYLYARVEKEPLAAVEALSQVLPEMIKQFHWPKSMRWGSGKFRWVRPLHSILCILDGEVVPFEIDGIKSGNKTFGHRFLSVGSFAVNNFDDYKKKLRNSYVILSDNERKVQISEALLKLYKEQGLKYDIRDNLIDEVSNLVEWPVILLGSFDPTFLELPEEVLISEMRSHQKYFALKKGDKLAPKFAFVSNIPGANGGREIVVGNERVLSARLHDAKFFWDQDKKLDFEIQIPKTDQLIFHEKLGSMKNKATANTVISAIISESVPNSKDAVKAAEYGKVDLVSGMVGEFPDLQGIMGGYYAEHFGFNKEVALAIKEQYLPKGPDDPMPETASGRVYALAEKITSLVGLWLVGEKPTGSKDPFALRRAALGLIRIICENNYRLNLFEILPKVASAWEKESSEGNNKEIVDFLIDRLKVQQKEKGVRHDLIDAVFSVGGEDDLVRLLARVTALQEFLKTDDGANLLAGYKRAVNIVKIEEKKDGTAYSGKIDAKLLKEKEELALFKGLEEARSKIATALKVEKFADAMAAVAVLRKPIDAFFDKVTVNTDERMIRVNRLRLLSGIREALIPVADFSKIEG